MFLCGEKLVLTTTKIKLSAKSAGKIYRLLEKLATGELYTKTKKVNVYY